MSNKFAISDTHFDHENIIRFCNRPFKDVEEMNEKMIENWNAIVRPNDMIYHLGDFAMKSAGRQAEYFGRLNGLKILIRGNHDGRDILKLGWYQVHDYLETRHDGHKIVIFHYPIERWNKQDGGSLHIHGHTHTSPLPTVVNRFNLGVELINYTPVNLDDIVAKAVPADQIKPGHAG